MTGSISFKDIPKENVYNLENFTKIYLERWSWQFEERWKNQTNTLELQLSKLCLLSRLLSVWKNLLLPSVDLPVSSNSYQFKGVFCDLSVATVLEWWNNGTSYLPLVIILILKKLTIEHLFVNVWLGQRSVLRKLYQICGHIQGTFW